MVRVLYCSMSNVIDARFALGYMGLVEGEEMKDEDIYQFVRQRWEKRDRGISDPMRIWQKIADDLGRKHVSERTGRPLTANAVRSLYYNFEKKPKLQPGDIKAALENMRLAFRLNAEPEAKLKLLEQIFKTIES